MKDIKIFESKQFGKVRIVVIRDEPWFVGKDVAEALGYSNSRDALAKRVDAEDKGGAKCDTLGGEQEVTIINESGLYSLVLSSHLPQAKEFKRWVTSEVLPSIRKTGRYSVKGKDSEETLKIRRDATEARLIAAKTAQAKTWMKLSKMFDNEDFSQIARTYAANTLAGKEVLSLPVATKKTMSATEVGEACGISAIRVGRIANTHGLKTDEYGKLFLDKSKYSNKTVETFRYYESVIPVIQEILESELKLH